jgi:general secretion pathway protein K
MAVSFMVAVTVHLFATINWQMQASVNLRDSVALDAANRSGLSLARAALEADRKENQFDSVHDPWHTLEKQNLAALLGQRELSVTVTDLSGLLQVNALDPAAKGKEQPAPGTAPNVASQKTIWRRFLTSGRFGEIETSEADALIDAIKDWIDVNDATEDHGAESGYYLSLAPPYEPRNGPVQYPEELLLIKGMTPELFYGNEVHPGIGEFISVAGSDGKVNINTAPPEVLMALTAEMDEEMARLMIEFREDENNKQMLANPNWYHTAGVPGFVVIPPDILTVQSSSFRIRSTARNQGITRTGEAVLERNNADGTQVLLSWEVR